MPERAVGATSSPAPWLPPTTRRSTCPSPSWWRTSPGGSGAISFAYVAGKKGDPYFMLTAVTSFLTTPILRKSTITYKDFTPLANFAFDEYMLMVKGDSKYKTVKDVVAFAKANPKKMTVGGTQLGSSDSVCSYLLEKAAGVQLNYIVFNSGGEVNAALMGGHIDLAVSNPGEALELAKANKVRLLGVYAEKRLAGAPDVPTLKEQGLDVTYVQNRGLGGAGWHPRGCPQDDRGGVPEVHEERRSSRSTWPRTCSPRPGWTGRPSASGWTRSTPGTRSS